MLSCRSFIILWQPPFSFEVHSLQVCSSILLAKPFSERCFSLNQLFDSILVDGVMLRCFIKLMELRNGNNVSFKLICLRIFRSSSRTNLLTLVIHNRLLLSRTNRRLSE
jgi:hypothetical protein